MTYTTNKSTRTDAYEFTIDTKSDKALVELKAEIAAHNAIAKKAIADGASLYDGKIMFMRVCVKPRGPRFGADRYHTLTANATHFDVYVQTDADRLCAYKWANVGRT
tara:strand:+ start:184 stop:504 length:321 start_codon:yes stop_codon:yes gene_type:complete